MQALVARGRHVEATCEARRQHCSVLVYYSIDPSAYVCFAPLLLRAKGMESDCIGCSRRVCAKTEAWAELVTRWLMADFT